MPTYEPGDILLDRYRIERLIGAGAFAEVYLVAQLALNAHYALKILKKNVGIGSTFFADYIQRFRLEAQLGAALKSPYIVQVYDFEEADDLLVLRMDYAPGGSLQQRLDAIRRKTAPPMPIDEAVRIAREVALGLAELHELDAVHRDVKPSNILFDDKDRAMLADLGLAQAPGGPSMRSQLSEAMPHPGTPAYMSPEQARPPFAHLTPASDIYALGAVLFEMLTTRVYKSQRPGTPVTKFRPDTPDWLMNLLNRMLAKYPEERLWDGEETAALLQEGASRAQKEAEENARLAAAAQANREAEARARKEAEAARKRVEEERKRQERAEAERKRREQEAAEKRKQEEEAARKRAEEERKRQEKAEAERKRREREAAEKARREAEVQVRKKEAEKYYQQGIEHHSKGEYGKAIADYTKAIELDPERADFYRERSISYYLLDNRYKATVDYTKAIELDPNYADHIKVTELTSNHADPIEVNELATNHTVVYSPGYFSDSQIEENVVFSSDLKSELFTIANRQLTLLDIPRRKGASKDDT